MSRSDALPIAVLSTRKDGIEKVRQRLQRPTFDLLAMAEVERKVRDILSAVRQQGDEALVAIERQVGWKGCTKEKLRVDDKELEEAERLAPKVPSLPTPLVPFHRR